MAYLILSILSSTGIFVTFKLIDRNTVHILHAIIINYITAFLFGLILQLNQISTVLPQTLSWLWVATLIGVLFILMFFIVARSTQQAGITVTTIASKMSVVFPISLSIILEPDDYLSLKKIIVFVLALCAVLLASWKNNKNTISGHIIFLPFILFIGMGLVDSFVKYAQFISIDEELTGIFSTITFLISALTGLFIFAFKKTSFRLLLQRKTVLHGGMLGIFNFGSIYFMLMALNRAGRADYMPESSVIFGINNLGIVLLSVFAGIIAFRETINYINLIGVGVSIITIYLLMKV